MKICRYILILIYIFDDVTRTDVSLKSYATVHAAKQIILFTEVSLARMWQFIKHNECTKKRFDIFKDIIESGLR